MENIVKKNNKGFTLVELVATIVILSIVMGIGAYSITEVINKNKKNSYEMLITEIKDAVEGYYQECRFVDYNCSEDPISLGYLVEQGFLKGNEKTGDGFTLVNPIYVKKGDTDSDNISGCEIKYKYENGEIIVESVGLAGGYDGPCPTTADYR